MNTLSDSTVVERVEHLRPYARWVRDPANGFVSAAITRTSGTEYSVWAGTSVEKAATS
jgi:hypothetical protein